MARLTLSRFIREQCQKLKPVVKTDLSGKTVVVIGANTGLGFEAAKHFATMNPERLILGCRSKEKGEAALSKLREATSYDRAELWLIDLSKFDSVKAFADKFEKEGGRLDILVENAGVMASPSDEKTADGFAPIFQVNDIAPNFHALLLLPFMVKTANEHNTSPRIVLVSSDMHYWGTLDKKWTDQPKMLEALSSKEYSQKTSVTDQYSDSKLLNVLFARELQKRISKTCPAITVNSLNPGYCYSDFRRSMTGVMAMVDGLMERMLAFTTEEGSRQLVYAAVGGTENEEKMKGGYVSFNEIVEVSDIAMSKRGFEVQEKYWDELVELSKDLDNRIPGIVDQYLSK